MKPCRIHFILEGMVVEAPSGISLEEVATFSHADITFGCKSGSCGTCRVSIPNQHTQCIPPSAEEASFIKQLGGSPNERLACQVKILGDINVEYLGL
ncbi:MAG: 2Fe-2S iron-sulfur cluster-binding protein [Holophagaceae bacterium]|jgi:ferredoxin